MKRRYVHILRVMQPGETVYFAEESGSTRLEASLTSTAYRAGLTIETKRMVATTLDPNDAHTVVRVRILGEADSRESRKGARPHGIS